jgi:hypothetical protein
MKHIVNSKCKFSVTEGGHTKFLGDNLSQYASKLYIGSDGLASGIVYLYYLSSTSGTVLSPVIVTDYETTAHSSMRCVLFVPRQQFYGRSFADISENFEAYTVLPDLTKLQGQMSFYCGQKRYIIQPSEEARALFKVSYVDGSVWHCEPVTMYELYVAMSNRDLFHQRIFKNNQ